MRSVRPRDPLSYVVLSLGGPQPGFELPRPAIGGGDADDTLRGGRVEPTAITQMNQLPDQWIGYDTADLVILNTGPGSDEFLRRLFGENASEGDRAKRVPSGGEIAGD